MKAVILAGGEGKRLRPYTYVLPKPLLPLGEEPILDRILEKLRKQGITDIFLAVNYKEQLFKMIYGDGSEKGVNITYLKESKPLGTAGPLKNLEGKVTESFFVINGDVISDLDVRELEKFHERTNSDITVVTRKIKTPINFGVLDVKEDQIVKWTEKPIIESEIATGMYMINPFVLKYIPYDNFYDMNNLVGEVMKNKGKVFRFEYDGQWIFDVGSRKDYKEAQEFFGGSSEAKK